MKHRPTNFVEIVQWQPTDLGYTNASSLGGGRVWLNPNKDGTYFVCHLQWTHDIREDLISLINPDGSITNSDPELDALVLHDATFPEVCTSSTWRAPFIGSNNTLTVAWTLKEAAVINPMVVNLLYICAIINTNSSLTPAVFYHPGLLNNIADDASHMFNLTNPQRLYFFSDKFHLNSLSFSGQLAILPVTWLQPWYLLYSTQTAVREGCVPNSHTINLYKQWATFCADLQLDYRFQNPDTPTIEIL